MNSELLNGLAGLAALLNGLLLWPIIRSLKQVTKNLDHRVTKLESPRARRKRAK